MITKYYKSKMKFGNYIIAVRPQFECFVLQIYEKVSECIIKTHIQIKFKHENDDYKRTLNKIKRYATAWLYRRAFKIVEKL